MDYQPYYLPITLRKTFGKECSPSPSHSEITAHKIFDFKSEDMTQSPVSVEKTECNWDLNPPPPPQLTLKAEQQQKGLHLAWKQFPILNHYQDLWPARGFAKMYLKNKVGTDKAKFGLTTTSNLFFVCKWDVNDDRSMVGCNPANSLPSCHTSSTTTEELLAKIMKAMDVLEKDMMQQCTKAQALAEDRHANLQGNISELNVDTLFVTGA
ncbi:hypothetical protein F5J12DRAFT_779761 [Pisolithus orientalis]|uniref:uncharacterized protein n=1 Tax=Pisolithus orientalis TaxID=936130 RepID=UPI002225979E|nr:uncharacterized protein F5J12DRAFT_779761 [Pisolithus orientalis]KAI6030667.1 hypothetical protein F5J12DRAFT_779761 [Pisolithus orientalis]